METKTRMVVIKGWGKRNGKLCNEYRVSVLQDKKVLEICSTTLCIQLTLMHVFTIIKKKYKKSLASLYQINNHLENGKKIPSIIIQYINNLGMIKL